MIVKPQIEGKADYCNSADAVLSRKKSLSTLSAKNNINASPPHALHLKTGSCVKQLFKLLELFYE